MRYKKEFAKLYPQGEDRRSKEFQVGTSSHLKDRASNKAGEIVGVSGRYIDIAEEVIIGKPFFP